MTRRIAIIGANGRLGSELVLRLNAATDVDVDVVAICRNGAGSAFLRQKGITCRMGSLTDPGAAVDLVGDSDLVVNLAYSFPRSAAGGRTNLALVKNSVAALKPTARVVMASTIMVYGPAFPVRLPDAYGLEKLRLERTFLRAAAARGARAHVFRIGHALGDLQPLTRQITAEIRAGATSVTPDDATPSNTVHVASLAEALVGLGDDHPKVIDMVSSPQWTWGEVYSWYADALGLPVVRGVMPIDTWTVRRSLREAALVANQFFPERLAERMYGQFSVRRARRELAATSVPSGSERGIEATTWRSVANGNQMHGLSDARTASLRFPMPDQRPA